MARLRGPGGCPWDRAQSHATLRRYLLEEAHEVLETLDDVSVDGAAPDAAADGKLCEELGDLLLQIAFHAQLANERGAFGFDDVCAAINAKLLRRHPHVFGDVEGIERAEEVLGVWEERKRAERGGEALDSALDGVPRGLPALARALDLQKRAARVGFDWPDQASRLQKIEEELKELDEALERGERAAIESEFGDVLFMVVNVGRGLGLGAEDALRSTNAKFERRFRAMEAAAGGAEAFAALDLAAQDGLWNQVKRDERHAAER